MSAVRSSIKVMNYFPSQSEDCIYLRSIKNDPSYKVIKREVHAFMEHDGNSLVDCEESLPSVIEYNNVQYDVLRKNVSGGYPGDFSLVIDLKAIKSFAFTYDHSSYGLPRVETREVIDGVITSNRKAGEYRWLTTGVLKDTTIEEFVQYWIERIDAHANSFSVYEFCGMRIRKDEHHAYATIIDENIIKEFILNEKRAIAMERYALTLFGQWINSELHDHTVDYDLFQTYEPFKRTALRVLGDSINLEVVKYVWKYNIPKRMKLY